MNSKYKSIEQYGSKYVKDYLSLNKEELLSDPYKAFLFFLSKSFNRGRNDEISDRFYNRTVAALDKVGSFNNILSNEGGLDSLLVDNQVNNHKDRDMVIDAIRYIKGLEGYNIVSHAVEQIKAKHLQSAHREIDDIKQIGHKLASLFIRDVVFLFKLESYLSPEDQNYCQPIDTWVRQIVSKLEITVNGQRDEDVAVAIVKKCTEVGVSSLLFNAGAWLVGKDSFSLLFDRL